MALDRMASRGDSWEVMIRKEPSLAGSYPPEGSTSGPIREPTNLCVAPISTSGDPILPLSYAGVQGNPVRPRKPIS